ncbi:T9SS type A sorting domain-containing protein [Rhodocaloribacter litoris]|uniref:T9SS type A sorting domain-containing protein n=1 Tax=Rhodocaloribacter litoris TaxID=2558931 RepID=UPI003C6E0A5B|nr:T9SS type A sorting domain-containing protein [Rhodocaloribacter litoris]
MVLKVYDVLGREVATLVDGMQQAGSQEIQFEGADLASGLYVYRLEASGQIVTGRMLLQK